jgi:TPP-dependent indolepyruvate ferredoxin oxidoreductase alpha subunit
MGSGNNIDSWVDIAKRLADAGADMVELNLACPNIGIMQKTLGELTGNEEEVLGAIVGQSPSLAGRIVEAVRAELKVPIMAKLTPEAADISVVAKANLEECNGCGICAKPGHCEAVTIKNKKAYVDKKLCVGCATCSDLCPTGAMEMVEDAEAYRGDM